MRKYASAIGQDPAIKDSAESVRAHVQRSLTSVGLHVGNGVQSHNHNRSLGNVQSTCGSCRGGVSNIWPMGQIRPVKCCHLVYGPLQRSGNLGARQVGGTETHQGCISAAVGKQWLH